MVRLFVVLLIVFSWVNVKRSSCLGAAGGLAWDQQALQAP